MLILPDWLAMRNGDYGYFPDGVAFPETKDQVAELVNFCHEKNIVLIPFNYY